MSGEACGNMRCACGGEAVWSLVIADPLADDFIIRPDLCENCYSALPAHRQVGWRHRAVPFDPDDPSQRPDFASPPTRQYLLAVEGQLLWVGVGTDEAENPDGYLTDDILEQLVVLAQHQSAREAGWNEVAKHEATYPRAELEVQTADVSAPFLCSFLTEEQARAILPPEDAEDLLQAQREQQVDWQP